MRPSDFYPTNPFSEIAFAVGGATVTCAITAVALGWYITAGFLAVAVAVCLCIVRTLETRRIHDEAKARRDAAEDAAALVRPYEPEGDP